MSSWHELYTMNQEPPEDCVKHGIPEGECYLCDIESLKNEIRSLEDELDRYHNMFLDVLRIAENFPYSDKRNHSALESRLKK